MGPLEEHYQTLDAPPAASLEEIRLIYRDLTQVWHPDRFPENPRLREKAEAKLKSINTAYEIIRKSRKSGERPKPLRPKPQPQPKPSRPVEKTTFTPDESAGLGWYAKAAAEGQADAQCIIATMYAEGQGVPRDENKALGWFRKSAAQGHPAAEFQMGVRYYSGTGLPKDPQQAFRYYQRAAFQGHAKAQFYLGIMFTNGQYISQDNVTAFAWFTIAAENHHPDAETLCDSVNSMLSEGEKASSIREIAKLRSRIRAV